MKTNDKRAEPAAPKAGSAEDAILPVTDTQENRTGADGQAPDSATPVERSNPDQDRASQAIRTRLQADVFADLYMAILADACDAMLRDIEAGEVTQFDLFDAEGDRNGEVLDYLGYAFEQVIHLDYRNRWYIAHDLLDSLSQVLDAETFAYFAETRLHARGGR